MRTDTLLPPKFYRFESACGHGYPKIHFIQTLRLCGEAGESKVATDRTLTDYFNKLVRGEAATIDTEPLELPLVDIESIGSKWPDIMGHGNHGHHFIFSERAMEVMDREHVTGYSARSVKIGKIGSKKLREKKPLQYYCIEVTGGIDILKKYYDETPDGYNYVGEVTDGEDNTYYRVECSRTARFYPIEDSWDGGDWFLMRNHGHFRHYGCSRKLVELAYREKWTNCAVAPMDRVIGDRTLKLPLPSTGKLPSVWYSEKHPQQ
ncbi:MAG: hypothetical protein WCS43_12685 [Verrucomicrobiota bacterium]